MTCIRRVALTALVLLTSASYATAQGASTWFLAEGANNATFAQEILVGNPSAQALKVTVTLLPQSDAVLTWESRTFDLAATSRLTVRLGPDFGLNGSASARVTAVLASDSSTPADIVVERTMYFHSVGQQGSHNASGVTQTQLSSKWILAEGAGGTFETYVLVANPNPTPTTVKATYLTGTGETYDTTQIAPPNSRITFYPKGEHEGLAASGGFSTEIESLTSGNLVVAERAMYFDDYLSGHDAIGVTSPNTTWLFAEGYTDGNGGTAYETFLLLANTNTTETDATVDFLLDSGEVISRTYTLEPRQRFNVWVDHEGRTFDPRLSRAAFGMRVTSTQPIVAERAMYWGPPSAEDPTSPSVWVEGHAVAGVNAGSPRWAFAEGQQGRFGAAAAQFETFFLLANPTNAPITVQATFVREDGTGIVRTVCLGANARTNIWTAVYSELAGQRFATFLESIASADTSCPSSAGTPFVAERAVYSSPGAGHVNGGTPWTGAIVAPPVAPAFAIINVSPSSGRLGGGQTITITGAGFQPGAKVYFDNPAWTGDRNNNTRLADVDQAIDVVVSQDGTTITAKTPARDFYNGYQTAGPTTVRVVNPGDQATTLANGYTFKLNVLAFGDDYVWGSTSGGGRAATPFPASLQNRLRAYQKDLLNPSTGAPTGTKVLQFGEYVTVTNAGVVGECASATGGGCIGTAGVTRFPALADAAASADKYDVVVFVEGVNDIRAGVAAGSVAFIYRDMVARARDRKIVILMTKFEGNGLGIGGLSDGQVKDLGDALWGVTEDTSLNVEIYRQPLFSLQTSGGYPTESGYDRISQLVFDKLAREFPLQPCDARNDKPGKGCPRNP